MKPTNGAGWVPWTLLAIGTLALALFGWFRWSVVHRVEFARTEARLAVQASDAARSTAAWIAERVIDADRLAAYAEPFLADSSPDSQELLTHAIRASALGREWVGAWLIDDADTPVAVLIGSSPLEAPVLEMALAAFVTGQPQIVAPMRSPSAALVAVAHPVLSPQDSTVIGVAVLASGLEGHLQENGGAFSLFGRRGDSIVTVVMTDAGVSTVWSALADSAANPLSLAISRDSGSQRWSNPEAEEQISVYRRVGSDLLSVVAGEPVAGTVGAARIQLTREYLGLFGIFAIGFVSVVAVGRQRRVTGLRATAQANERERDKYRALFEYSNDGVIITDSESRVVEANDAFLEMSGYQLEEVVGRPVEDFAVRGERPYHQLPDSAGTAPLVEGRLVAKNGSEIWIEINAARIPGEGDGPSHIQSVIRDITARKTAEAALSESEARWKSIAENPFEMVAVIGPDHRVQMVNRYLEGYSEEEMLGSPVYDLTHPDEHDDLRQALVSVFETGRSAYVEARSARSGRWYAHALGPINDGLGVSAVSSLSWDVDEIHKTREEIVRVRDHYVTLLAAFPYPVWHTDAEGTRTYFNEKWLEMVGRPLEDEFGNGWAAHVHPDDLEGYMRIHRKAFADRTNYEVEFRILDKNQDYRVLHESGQPYADLNGNFAGLLGVTKDITDELALQRALQTSEKHHREAQRAGDEVMLLNRSLEQQVQRQTQEFQRVNDEFESFSYSVSHDLKAPLRTIRGFAELIFEDHADSIPREGRRLLTQVKTAALKLEGLLEALLELSRLARVELNRGPIQMRQLVNEIVKDLPPDVMGDAEIRVVELPTADGDAVLIRQVWANLIDNALKFTRNRKKPMIEVGGRSDPGENMFWVRDNGVGFPPEHADRVFKVFDRLHSDDEFPGTGVGLATVDRIVARHGGRVTADAKEGGGALVGFALPRSDA